MIVALAYLFAGQVAPTAAAPPPSAAPAWSAPASSGPPAWQADAPQTVGFDVICYSGRGSMAAIGGQQSEVKLDESKALIRLPSAVASGSKAKWTPIDDLDVTDREVTGTISGGTFSMHHDRVRIDRITGTMVIGGKKPSFVGHCDTSDAVIAKRAF